MSGFADNDETVDIIKIPAAVADTGVCNPELTVYIALFPGRIAEKQTVQCAGTGDKCVGAEDRDKRAGGKSHMKFQTALVISAPRHGQIRGFFPFSGYRIRKDKKQNVCMQTKWTLPFWSILW